MTSPVARELHELTTRTARTLRGWSEERAETPGRPGAWTPKEIVGHLIDSASNNHDRFVRAQLQGHLRFSGYAQEDWVSVQRHREAPWPALVDLWEAFNVHLARVIDHVPDELRHRETEDHNLDELAWEAVPAGEPVSLEYFMRDYVGHLRHHLRQLDPALSDPPTPQRGGALKRS